MMRHSEPSFPWRLLTVFLVLLLAVSGCKTMTSVTKLSGPILGATYMEGASSSAARLEDPKSEAALAYRSASKATTEEGKLQGLLHAASLALPGAMKSQEDPDDRKIYNAASAEAAALVHRIAKEGGSGDTIEFEGGPIERVEIVDADGRDFLEQEQIFEADRIEVRRLPREAKLPGVGGTLVAYSSKESGLYADNPNVLLEGLSIPLTATVSFPSSKTARIRIDDPGVQNEVTVGSRRVPLAADFSTPLGWIGSQGPKNNLENQALFEPGNFEEIRGLGFLEPYEEDQIPVVFIHGLKSLPRVWKEVYLELLTDERLRENMQFWFYRYPTGYGIGMNAHEFRTAFREAIDLRDPRGRHRALKETVLIGHSMGGLITSCSIRYSGNAFWEKMSDRGIDEVDLKPEHRELIRGAAFFEPIPEVSRAIFAAAPHRGSEIASGAVGEFGISLIKLPQQLVSMSTSSPIGPDSGLTPLGQEVMQRKGTSIDHLKPNNWVLDTLVDLPVSSRVTMHSIIGRKNEVKPLEESTDGVVPYWSSHLDGVASEKIVASDHDVPSSDETIEEIRRILHLHLDSIGR